ncbi:hypothetical protein [Aulosira sp. FACHB-615]|uniref:hypothetical protein n=1 Tax=Aulosira sp. FACHB-615 TaxID=2692777 RepID=UPI0016885BB4|nr:hypothetical protein [Aulosira sp. FACHB-615]MBD2488973.1 hypothetical protein [Aulosira sp. FACHB-615]
MNLDELITNAYSKYQAELKAQKEAKEAEEKRWVENAIAEFRLFLDKAIPLEIQQELGVEIKAVYNQSAWAEFTFYNEAITIYRHGSDRFTIDNCGHTLGDRYYESDDFLNALLIELGKIRAENPVIDLEEVNNIRKTLGRCCAEIGAISESDLWKRLCEKYCDPKEMKTFLKDVVCLLGDAMGCVDEVAK